MFPQNNAAENPIDTLISSVEASEPEADGASGSFYCGNSEIQNRQDAEIRDYILRKLQAATAITRELGDGPSHVGGYQDRLIRILENLYLAEIPIKSAIIGSKNLGYPERRKRLTNCLPIVVSKPPNTILRVIMPPLIGRKITGSYNQYWSVKYAIEQYKETHPIEQIYGEKLLLIYKKYAHDLSVDYTCDNDNWEAKRTTNAISEGINYSDNAANFSFMYTAVLSDACCVEATVIRLSDLPLFYGYLTNSCPENHSLRL